MRFSLGQTSPSDLSQFAGKGCIWFGCQPQSTRGGHDPLRLLYHPERFSREFERKQATYNRLNPTTPLPRLRLHDLRHTWATLALEAGVHPKVVQERFGHTTIATTMNVYSHAIPGMQSEAAEQVSAMIFQLRS